ncbi:MAG: hypothetical protein QXN68_00445 [Thermoplasmata archaeon]
MEENQTNNNQVEQNVVDPQVEKEIEEIAKELEEKDFQKFRQYYDELKKQIEEKDKMISELKNMVTELSKELSQKIDSVVNSFSNEKKSLEYKPEEKRELTESEKKELLRKMFFENLHEVRYI